MGEAIQDGARQAFVVEDLVPLLERQVRGDDDACPLVGLTDHIEQDATSLTTIAVRLTITVANIETHVDVIGKKRPSEATHERAPLGESW